MINNRQIEAFRALILSGSATSAANFLGISQPAVSRLIQDLERRLRIKLFQRTGGRLMPTGDAMTLYREVERSFVGLDRIERVATDLRERRGGALRVAALPALAVGFLPELAADFLARRPTVDIALHGMNSPFVLDWVTNGQCDLGIVGQHFQHAGINVEMLPPVAAVAVLPGGHALAEKEVVTPEDLEGQDFISIAAPSLIRFKFDVVMQEHKARPRVRAETPLTMIACGMVAAGFGCAVVDPFTAKRYRGGNLVVRPFRPIAAFEWAIITASLAPESLIVSEFTASFVEAFSSYRVGD
ncbi:LysR substrate-binding domain-containing protein [Methylopila sp. 73B]|uniref:LysR substrate-binding domain-containing protein n=1 Tax=Methylopila sp. 73B TaxID=1120792 RepID=UPI000375ACF1|nr:LysR substrate-binding domain-containing protein [Methylopila sp. 73B]